MLAWNDAPLDDSIHDCVPCHVIPCHSSSRTQAVVRVVNTRRVCLTLGPRARPRRQTLVFDADAYVVGSHTRCNLLWRRVDASAVERMHLGQVVRVTGTRCRATSHTLPSSQHNPAGYNCRCTYAPGTWFPRICSPQTPSRRYPPAKLSCSPAHHVHATQSLSSFEAVRARGAQRRAC